MIYTMNQTLVNDPGRKNFFQTFLIAVGLFVCSAALFATIPRFSSPFATPIHKFLYTVVTFLWWEYLALGLIAGSALLAVYDQGLRREWVFVFACGAGVGINLGGIGITGDMPGLLFRVLWAGLIGFVTAAILGTLGGLLGFTLRRMSSK
jgi:hypothetical protein